MHTPSYVYQNGFGIYYFRIAIPHHLRAGIGKHEIRRSLKTTNRHYAIREARRFSVIIEELFRSGPLDKQKLNEAIKNGSLHLPYQHSEYTGFGGYHGYRGYPAGMCTSPVQPQLLPAPQEIKPPSLRLKELIRNYVQCQQDENSWQSKTTDENQAIFKVLLDIVGDIPVTEINHATADSFRSVLKQLPPNMNKSPLWRDKSIEQILKAKPAEKLSNTSINKYMRRVCGLINWAEDREYISKNYFRIKPIKDARKANERRDILTSDDLAAIFSPDRFEAEADQPFKYWCPLIALYSGARQNEIAQLDGADIKKVHDVWCFRFITAKQKNYTERVVPVHSKLQALGLIEYAKSRPGKLFPELANRRDGYGHQVSRWYNLYRRKCGINGLRNKDFHSFRHTLSTELYRAGVNPMLIAEIDGHVTGDGKRRTTTEEVYIKSSEIDTLRDALEKLDYGEPLSRIRPMEYIQSEFKLKR